MFSKPWEPGWERDMCVQNNPLPRRGSARAKPEPGGWITHHTTIERNTSMSFEQTISREQARMVACPQCGAAAGENCRGTRGARTSNHKPRADAAKAALVEGQPITDRERELAGAMLAAFNEEARSRYSLRTWLPMLVRCVRDADFLIAEEGFAPPTAEDYRNIVEANFRQSWWWVEH
jgi:hypothetical protein